MSAALAAAASTANVTAAKETSFSDAPDKLQRCSIPDMPAEQAQPRLEPTGGTRTPRDAAAAARAAAAEARQQDVSVAPSVADFTATQSPHVERLRGGATLEASDVQNLAATAAQSATLKLSASPRAPVALGTNHLATRPHGQRTWH